MIIFLVFTSFLAPSLALCSTDERLVRWGLLATVVLLCGACLLITVKAKYCPPPLSPDMRPMEPQLKKAVK